MAVGALVALVVVVSLVVGAETLGDGGLLGIEDAAEIEADGAVAPTTTTTLPEGGMVLSTTSTTAAPAPAPDTGDGAVVDPGPTPPTAAPQDPVVVTVPPPAPPAADLAVSPSRVATVHPNGQVVVSWSTTGATSVSVAGPGLSSSSSAGSQGVCPGTVVSSVCRVAPGTYTYRLVATGPGGTVERTAAVTVA